MYDQFFSRNIIMKNSTLEEDKNLDKIIIKDARNLFRLKKLTKQV